MTEDAADVIFVDVAFQYELAADRADLHVTIQGASLVTGGEALKKAAEIAQLVQDLARLGLPPENIFLEGISAEATTGTVLKSSRARYRLRVHCAQLDTLADTFGVIAAQKNATLRRIAWGYPDDTLRDQWLAECIARANEKAAKIAAGLGVRLLGISRFRESIADPEANAASGADTLSDDTLSIRRRARPVTQEDLGLEVSHTKRVDVMVHVAYRISGFETHSP